MNSSVTGSQKVGGSNPPSSTKKAKISSPRRKILSTHRLTGPNSQPATDVTSDRLTGLVDGFILTCTVEDG